MCPSRQKSLGKQEAFLIGLVSQVLNEAKLIANGEDESTKDRQRGEQ